MYTDLYTIGIGSFINRFSSRIVRLFGEKVDVLNNFVWLPNDSYFGIVIDYMYIIVYVQL